MTDIKELIEKLNEEYWLVYVEEISKKLKPKIQKNGVLKAIREKVDEDYKERVNSLHSGFISDKSIINLDDQVKNLTDEILKINNIKNNSIYYEFFKHLKHIENQNNEFDELILIANLIDDTDINISTKMKLNNIISKIINQSINQSNKSNAGAAGETITESILKKIGFTEGTHYKKQFKSNEGSDTDFVYPYVDDFDDISFRYRCLLPLCKVDYEKNSHSIYKTERH